MGPRLPFPVSPVSNGEWCPSSPTRRQRRAAKRRILGLNAAWLYGIEPRDPRCTVPLDAIDREREAKGGVRAGRSLRVYGPRTRREFLAFWRGESRSRA